MSRELKFRAWVDEFNYYTYDIQEREDIFEWFGHPTIHIEQYTGLKDMKGKEIYEGDIVRDRYADDYVVKFGKHNIECCGCCYNSHQSVGFYLIKINCKKELVHACEDEWERLEVIGNIHENPDLNRSEG